MHFENFTDKAKGVIQSAQSLAIAKGHQKFVPDHLLKVMLEDDDGLIKQLFENCGASAADVNSEVDSQLSKLPVVQGEGAGQIYLSPEVAKVFEESKKLASKAGDSYVTVDRMLQAIASHSDVMKKFGINSDCAATSYFATI